MKQDEELKIQYPDYEKTHKERIKKRSITPDTYKEAKFVKRELEGKEDYFFYVETYQYKDCETSRVFRYAINTYREGLEKEIKEHNQDQQKLAPLSNNTKNQQTLAKNTKLTFHETLIIKEALDFLNNNKTILLDVFERDKTALASTKTHTALLYKNEEGEIFLIDPNNPSFSSHLANFDPKIKTEYSEKKRIYEPPEKAEEKNLIGPNHEQWRGCVDIAVKIAFGLNEEKNLKSLDAIYSSKAIKNIANITKINDSLPDEITDQSGHLPFPLRALQKSNLNVGRDFYKFSKTIKENLLSINSNKDSLRESYNKALTNSDQKNHIETLKDLYSLCDHTFKLRLEALENLRKETLGDFNHNLYE